MLQLNANWRNWPPGIRGRFLQHLLTLTRTSNGRPPELPSLNPWLKTVSPTFTWDVPHLLLVQGYLEKVARGEIRRLMVFLPPRHGKSELVTVRFPVYLLESDPRIRVIVGAYNQKLANTFSRKSRRLGRTRFGLDPEHAAVDDWETVLGGGVRAVGVGSGVTGRGGNVIIVDDPVKGRDEAESLAVQEKIWDWYTNDLYTRLEPDGAIIVMMTRWTEKDLAGRILSSPDAKNWTVVSLPAEAMENDPLGRPLGAPLWPERFNLATLAQSKAILLDDYWALFQQAPLPSGGVMFRREDLTAHIVERDEVPTLTWARYWDLALGMKQRSSYTASLAVAFGPNGDLYVRDAIRGHWEWPDAYEIIVDNMRTGLRDPLGQTHHFVEEKMHGLAAVQSLWRDPRIVNVVFAGVGVEGEKTIRALPWSKRCKAGKVRLVRGEWNEEFIAEAALFPRGAFDDQIDSVSGGVRALGFDESEALVVGENPLYS